MGTFAQAVAVTIAPGTTLVLKPDVFADEWQSKPREPVCVGLRLIPDSEKTKARFTAEELADQVHPKRDHNWIDAYNDALMRQVVALAICDPNDVKKPFELMPFAESDVSDAVTSAGASFIFGALARYELATDPNVAPAGDEDLARLSSLLGLVDASQLRVGLRRTVAELLAELEELVDASGVDDAPDELPVGVVGKQILIGGALGPR